MRALSIILAAFALAGCQTVVYRPVLLPVLPRPVLAPVAAASFACPIALPPPFTMCITDGTYNTLVSRERAYKTWGLQYEAEVKANNKAASARQK